MALIMAYLISLPVSVWLLANLLSIIDEPNKAGAATRLVASLVLIILALLFTDREYLTPLLLGFSTVLILHVAAFFIVRRLGLGVPIIEDTPDPDRPS